MVSGHVAFQEEPVAALQVALMQKVVALTDERGFDVGFVYFPTPEDAFQNSRPYQTFLASLPAELRASTNVFSIDLMPYVHNGSKSEGRILRIPDGHFDAAGNIYMGRGIVRHLRDRQ